MVENKIKVCVWIVRDRKRFLYNDNLSNSHMVQKQYRFAPKSIFTFVFLCFVAIVVIISTSSLVQVEESLDPIEVSDEIKKHDRKVVIFPSNFQSGNNKLADF